MMQDFYRISPDRVINLTNVTQIIKLRLSDDALASLQQQGKLPEDTILAIRFWFVDGTSWDYRSKTKDEYLTHLSNLKLG